MNSIKGFHFTPMSRLFDKYRLADTALSAMFTLRWIVLPLLQVPSLYTLLNILPLAVVGGFYLAFFFLISHNFVGVHLFNKDSKTHKFDSFLYKQVRYYAYTNKELKIN
jgi:hypothetical protein